jgi:cystathionine beta-lyase
MGRGRLDPEGSRMSGGRDETKLVAGGRRPEWTGPIVNPPVHRASTILFDSCAALEAGASRNADGDFHYGRRGTPTQWALAQALTDLEPGAAGTMLFPSGVAAIATALLAVLKPGDDLLMVDSTYGPTRAFCRQVLAPMGIATRFYDPLVGAGIADLIQDNTAAIFLESPGSLTFEVQDVPAIVAVAKARGIVTLLDNTWATPLLLPAMALGIDLSILACTKYVVGHSDVMLGSVTATAALHPAVRRTAQLHGQHVSPDDAYLAHRGLRTMAVRLRQHQESALTIAHWLDTRPEVARVLHPALPSCPGHAAWLRDFKGSTGLFSFVLNGGTADARAALIDGLVHFGIGYSWGGYESLALPIEPAAIRSATQWDAAGPAVRLHVGLEHVDDLIADLDAGLTRFRDEAG